MGSSGWGTEGGDRAEGVGGGGMGGGGQKAHTKLRVPTHPPPPPRLPTPVSKKWGEVGTRGLLFQNSFLG